MQIYIDNNSMNHSFQDISLFQEKWNEELESINLQNRYISFVEIDGEVYYDNYELAIEQMFDRIQCVKVSTVSAEEHLTNLIASIKEYNILFVKGTRSISEYFYGEMNEQQWEQFRLFMEGLDWLYKSLEFALLLIKQTDKFHVCEESLRVSLSLIKPHIVELERALAEQDYVTVGDLMQYEIEPVFQQLFSNPVN